MSIHFLNWNKEDFLKLKYIYKYVALENFLKMLEGNYIHMLNPQEWKDPYESRFLCQEYKLVETEEMRHPFRDKLLATCFTHPSNCEAQWNTYSKGKPVVQISFKTETLLEQLLKAEGSDLYIGQVRYFNTRNDDNIKDEICAILNNVIPPTDEDWLRIMLLKRSPYSYEKEIRFLTVNDKNDKKEYQLHLSDITCAIEKVTLDPDNSKIYGCIEETKGLLTERNIQISKSGLYKKPKKLEPIKVYKK